MFIKDYLKFFMNFRLFMLMAIIILMAVNLKDVNLMITFLAVAGASALDLYPQLITVLLSIFRVC